MPNKETYEIIDADDLSLSEDIKKPDDLASALVGLFSISNLKLIVFLFIIFLFVSSDIFIEKFLHKFNNAVNNREPTAKGVMIQGIVLILLFMFMDIIIKTGLL